jgi:hypothetical protein
LISKLNSLIKLKDFAERSDRKKRKGEEKLCCVMLSLILFSTTLVIAVIGLPPVIIKQPVDAQIFFKVNGAGSFEIECEADGDPRPK